VKQTHVSTEATGQNFLGQDELNEDFQITRDAVLGIST
jgi:hypothetical protein